MKNMLYRYLVYSSLIGFMLMSSSPSFAQSMMTEREIISQYNKANAKYKAGRFVKASQLFFDLIENAEASPKYQRRSLYQLARSLYRQELHLVSLQYVIKFLKKTQKPDSFFINSLKGLIRITEKIGDETLIIKMLGQVPILRKIPKVGEDPLMFMTKYDQKLERIKNILETRGARKKLAKLKGIRRNLKQLRYPLAYFLGRRYFLLITSSKTAKLYLPAAEMFLKEIKADAPRNYYAKALYLRGVLLSRQGKNKESLKVFEELKKTNATGSKEKLANIQGFGQYGLARSYYALAFKQDQAKKYKKADKLYQRSINEYAKVPKKKGIFQAQMLFETAYTFFMMRKYHFSLGQLLALQSPYYRINFFPELRILRSLIYYRNCKYEDTKQTISIFQKKYNPLKATLETLVKKRKAGKVVKWRREYFKYFLKQDKQLKAKKKTEVPTSILEVVRTAKELRNYRQLLKKLSEELAIIRSKGAAWKESNLGKALIEAAGKIRVNLQNRAGDSVYDSLNNVFLELRRLLTQATLIRIESLRKQKEELLRYAEGGGIEQDEYFYTIVTEQNHIYWPYQGEYWRDEVGYYRQFIQGECKR